MKKFIFIMLFIAGVTIGVTFASAAYAIDVTMGSGGNLVFEPNEVTISAGDTVHFINNSLPPHNIIVESRPDLSRESLMFSPGESQDVVFAEAGDYEFFCGPHKSAGMKGTIHVN